MKSDLERQIDCRCNFVRRNRTSKHEFERQPEYVADFDILPLPNFVQGTGFPLVG